MRSRILGAVRFGAVATSMSLVLGSCAPKVPPPVTPGTALFPEFIFPVVPPRVGDQNLAARHMRAWQMLQSGDARGAEREYATLLRRNPGFFPGETGFAYVRVAGQQYQDAIARFDRALAMAPSYAPALAGRAEALLAAGQRDRALASFEAAYKADPSLADLSRRIDVLRFDRVRELVAAGRRAADTGGYEEARRAYAEALAASPQSAFLYRDLGAVEVRLGAIAEGLAHLRQALDVDPSDAGAYLALADALDRSGDPIGAVGAYERAYELDPSDATRAALARARARAEAAALPSEFGAIPGAARITRGDLAALLGVRLQPFVARLRARSGVVATDVRGHWAAAWIMSVTRAGLMDVYPNHTFQPRAAIRRADLALAVSRILSAGGAAPSGARSRISIADMSSDHLSYAAASAAVASGVMSLADGRTFRPSQPVSGAEATEVVERLARLVVRPRQEQAR
ncbi:MAG: S-layer homology domain-containing protein [Acidobacteriota bacterium]